jgi:hypothetical protein
MSRAWAFNAFLIGLAAFATPLAYPLGVISYMVLTPLIILIEKLSLGLLAATNGVLDPFWTILVIYLVALVALTWRKGVELWWEGPSVVLLGIATYLLFCIGVVVSPRGHLFPPLPWVAGG